MLNDDKALATNIVNVPQTRGEYKIFCAENFSLTARKTNTDCVVVLQKDKLKITLTLEEWKLLAVNKETVDLGVLLLKGKFGIVSHEAI